MVEYVAAGSASPRGTGPASLAEDEGDQGGDPAWSLDHVAPSEAQWCLAAGNGQVVPVHVEPSQLEGVSEPSVEFDGGAVVAVVQVAVGAPCL